MNESDAMDLVFGALAHPARRYMLDLLVQSPGMSVSALASHFEISRVAVMKHLQALEAAELVISEKDGRVRRLHFNPMPIQRIHDRWTSEYSRFWAGHLADLQARVEARARSRRHA